MNARQFLLELRQRDIRVWVEGDALRCNAPSGALSLELKTELQQRKAEIIEFLKNSLALASERDGIVPLQAEGDGLPIFAVPGHNGDVFCFRALAAGLGHNYRFYGLHPPGLNGRSAPLDRIEELAGYFTKQIRAVIPNRECVIAAYCAGGSTALEIAHQLRKVGIDVRLLALFGTPHPEWYRVFPQVLDLVKRTAERALRHVRAVGALTLAQLREYIATRAANLRAERLARNNDPADPLAQWKAALERATLKAIRTYRPSKYDGKTCLFLPDTKYSEKSAAFRGWRTVANSLESFAGPATSSSATMLREPNVGFFSESFRTILNAIEVSGSCTNLRTPNPQRTQGPNYSARHAGIAPC